MTHQPKRAAMIKTRADARRASSDKWAKILEEITELENDVDSLCGYCWLAINKVPEKTDKKYSVKCKYCEPDAERLCLEYMTGSEASINQAFIKFRRCISTLKDKVVAWPVTKGRE